LPEFFIHKKTLHIFGMINSYHPLSKQFFEKP